MHHPTVARLVFQAPQPPLGCQLGVDDDTPEGANFLRLYGIRSKWHEQVGFAQRPASRIDVRLDDFWR